MKIYFLALFSVILMLGNVRVVAGERHDHKLYDHKQYNSGQHYKRKTHESGAVRHKVSHRKNQAIAKNHYRFNGRHHNSLNRNYHDPNRNYHDRYDNRSSKHYKKWKHQQRHSRYFVAGRHFRNDVKRHQRNKHHNRHGHNTDQYFPAYIGGVLLGSILRESH